MNLVKRSRHLINSIRIKIAEKQFDNQLKYILNTNRSSDVLIVVFSGFPGKNGASYNYMRTLKEVKCNKLFILDVGLLCALSKLPARTLIDGDKIFTEFNGALAEQYVLQQLKTLDDMEVAYWISKSGNAEIDFVIQTDGYVIPVEVKATTNLQAKSLKVYREKFEPEISIRTSLADFEINNGLFNIPLFMAGKFDEILKEKQ